MNIKRSAYLVTLLKTSEVCGASGNGPNYDCFASAARIRFAANHAHPETACWNIRYICTVYNFPWNILRIIFTLRHFVAVALLLVRKELVYLHRCPLSLGSRRSETRLGEWSSTSCITILMASASTDIWRAAAIAAADGAGAADDGRSVDESPRDDSPAIALNAPVLCCNAAISGLWHMGKHRFRNIGIYKNQIFARYIQLTASAPNRSVLVNAQTRNLWFSFIWCSIRTASWLCSWDYVHCWRSAMNSPL